MVFISNGKNYMFRPEDGRYRPKRIVFSIANKHHHLAIYL